MEVKIAKSAGFCFGVQRAVDTVFHLTEKNEKPLYTYGPIIHNDEVIHELEERGVTVLTSEEELENLQDGCVVIRSHGVKKKIYSLLEGKGLEYVDATCPFVKKIHRKVEEYSALGYAIIIIGNGSHPEVEGICGWSSVPETYVISSPKEADNFQLVDEKKICVVSQTTFNNNKFEELVEIIQKKGYDIVVLNTICNATKERQTESLQLAKQSDAMIVIGDKNSSNTQKLFEICKDECENTYFIQTINGLDCKLLQSFDSVGITAGASTPNKIIEEVQKNVRNEF